MVTGDLRSPRYAPTRGTRMLRRVLSFTIVACLGVGVWIGRERLLRGLAEVWLVSDPVTSSDAAVVLGGGLEDRPFAAADLYQRGLVKRVLISQVLDDRAAAIGVMQGHTELNRQILLKLGVPADAIEKFGTANENTRDEAVSLRAWAERNNASSFIIPTEIFSTRRVGYIFRHELSTQSIEVMSLEPSQYTIGNWWTIDVGLIAFQNEVLKYLYYRMKY